MSAFFHGWRRKAACITLVMACVLVGAWIRSRNVRDALNWTFAGRQHMAVSTRERLAWAAFPYDSSNRRATPMNWYASEMLSPEGCVEVIDNRPRWEIQYSFVALPLTLFSAYMILWKPRKRVAP